MKERSMSMLSALKHRRTGLLTVLFTLVLTLSSVFAINAAADAGGLAVTINTDKEEYRSNEDIAISVAVRNDGSRGYENLSSTLTVPDGYEFKSGKPADGVERIAAGETVEFDSVISASAGKSGQENKTAPRTGDVSEMILCFVLMLISSVALIILNRKKIKRIISAVLCVTVLFSAVSAADCYADSSSSQEEISISKDISINGVKHTLSAVVRAGLSEDGKVTVTYVSNGGTKVESEQITRGSAIGEMPYSDKQGYNFTGWYSDVQMTSQFYGTDPVTNDITLYAGFEENDISAVQPEYSEVYLEDVQPDYKIKVRSGEVIDENNLVEFVSIRNTYGELPEFKVTGENGVYTIEAVGGYEAGGLYTIELMSDAAVFTDVNSGQLKDEQIKTITIEIYREDTKVIEYKDGIIEMDSSEVAFGEDDTFCTVSGALCGERGIQTGSVLFVKDGNDIEQSRYINVLSIAEEGDICRIIFEDSNPEDVYEDFDVHINDVEVENELIEKGLDSAEIEDLVYDSVGTQQLTYMLAAALYESDTVRDLGDGTEPFEMTGDSADNSGRMGILDADSVQGNAFSQRAKITNNFKLKISTLLEGLSITASVGLAKNANFNGIAVSDRENWTALSIGFTYDAVLKNKVSIHAEITVTEYLFVGMKTSANFTKGSYRAEVTPYSQTDVNFKILVASSDGSDEDKDKNKDKDKDNDKKDNKIYKDISVEIKELVNGAEDNSSQIISDVQKMLEDKGGAIELCSIPLFEVSVSPVPLVSINFNVNFVVSMSFAAGVSIDTSILEATTMGVTGNIWDKKIDCYRHMARGSDRYIFDFYAYGYLGLEAGLEGEVSLSFVGLSKLGRAGISLGVGAYADLYGYMHFHAEDRRVFKDIVDPARNYQKLEGGIYYEMGIYVKIGAFIDSKIIKKELKKEIEFKFKLLSVGDEYLYIEPALNEDMKLIFRENDNNTFSLKGIVPAEGKFLNIKDGSISTRPVDSDDIRIISNSRLYNTDNVSKSLIARPEEARSFTADSNVLYGDIELYYRGPNILFGSEALTNLNIPELKGYKKLGNVRVYYVKKGVEISDELVGKEVTVKYNVEVDGKTETVHEFKVPAGQNISGGMPDEVYQYLIRNSLLYNPSVDNADCHWDKLMMSKYMITEDTEFTLHTKKAQRFAVLNFFDSEKNEWVSELWALNYGDSIPIEEYHRKTSSDFIKLVQFEVDDKSGVKAYSDGKVELARYAPRHDGTAGYDVTKPLLVKRGSEEDIREFRDSLTGDYKTWLAYSMTAVYASGKCSVKIFDETGSSETVYVDYNSTFEIPSRYAVNMDNKGYILKGWDIDGDGAVDLEPKETFTVNGDYELRPVVEGKEYKLSITGLDGNTKEYKVRYGQKFDKEITDMLQDLPENPECDNENSFYESAYWTLAAAKVITGTENVYFSLPSRFRNDIDRMPACDITFCAVKPQLYHKIKFTADEGYFEYEDQNGNTARDNTVTINIADGEKIDYEEYFKYIAPDSTDAVKYISYVYEDAEGNILDRAETICQSPAEYHVKWNKLNCTWKINYEEAFYDALGNLISENTAYSFEGSKSEYDINKADCDKKYDALEAYTDEQYKYEIKKRGKGEYYNPDTGLTRQYYRVEWYRTLRSYDVFIDYDNGLSHQNSFEHGYKYTFPDNIFKTGDVYNSYTLAGYDTNGDGVADYKPGEEISIKSNMTIKAIWTSKPVIYNISFHSGIGKFDDGSSLFTLSGSYGESVDAGRIKIPSAYGYIFDGWDKSIPETFGSGDMSVTAKFRLGKARLTFRLVNDDLGTVVEDYAGIEADYNSTVTSNMLPGILAEAEGCLFSGWYEASTGNTADGITVDRDMVIEGRITPVYVIYSLNGKELKRIKTKIGTQVTVDNKADGYLDWNSSDVQITNGSFTMPASDVVLDAAQDLSGLLYISNGLTQSVIDTVDKKIVSGSESGYSYDSKNNIITITSDGLVLSGTASQTMIAVNAGVSSITLKDFTAVAGEMSKAVPELFKNAGDMDMMESRLGTADNYLLFIAGLNCTVNIEGTVNLSKTNNYDPEVGDVHVICQKDLTLSPDSEADMKLTFVGGENASLTLNGLTTALSTDGRVSFKNMDVNANGDNDIINSVKGIEFTDCNVDVSMSSKAEYPEYGLALYASLGDICFTDCRLNLSQAIRGNNVTFKGRTTGRIDSSKAEREYAVYLQADDTGEIEKSGVMTVDISSGCSLILTGENASVLAYAVQGGENKVIDCAALVDSSESYTVVDKDWYFTLKREDGTEINSLEFKGK